MSLQARVAHSTVRLSEVPRTAAAKTLAYQAALLTVSLAARKGATRPVTEGRTKFALWSHRVAHLVPRLAALAAAA